MSSILTVLTPAASQRLATLDAVRVELGITDAALSGELERLLDQASATLSSYCGRLFVRETVREVFRVPSGELLVLARAPVVGPVTITGDGTALVADADFELDPGPGLLYRMTAAATTRCWSGWRVTVTYAAGWEPPAEPYAAGQVPADVQRAAVLLVSSMRQGAGRDVLIRSESTEGVGSTAWLDPRDGMEQLPPQVAALVSGYRSMRVG